MSESEPKSSSWWSPLAMMQQMLGIDPRSDLEKVGKKSRTKIQRLRNQRLFLTRPRRSR